MTIVLFASKADDQTQKAKKVVGLPIILKVINEVYGQKVVAKSDSQLKIPLQQMMAVCTLLLMGKNTRASKEVNFAKVSSTTVMTTGTADDS